MMWIIFDGENRQAFGTFKSKDEAWRWIERQEVESGWAPEDPATSDLVVIELQGVK